MTNTDCLIANRFLAHCKKCPSCSSRCNPAGFVIKLKQSALCQISTECNLQQEAVVIRKFKRAFNVLTKKFATLHINQGILKCDYCASAPKIPNKHTGTHHMADFYLERIAEHPAVCIIDDLANQDLYAQINIEAGIQ